MIAQSRFKKVCVCVRARAAARGIKRSDGPIARKSSSVSILDNDLQTHLRSVASVNDRLAIIMLVQENRINFQASSPLSPPTRYLD